MLPGAAVPAARIAVRKDLDLFGPRGPLLRARSPPDAQAAGEQRGQDKEGAGETIGWCTFSGCSKPVMSWEQHVEHHISSHAAEDVRMSFCPECLAQVSNLQEHMLEHDMDDFKCSLCPASFIRYYRLKRHMANFHRRVLLPSFVPGSASPSEASSSSAPSAAVGPARTAVASKAPQLGFCVVTGCSQILSTWQGYVDHCLERHAPVPCLECLEAHAEPHGPEDSQCNRCPARFVEASRLLIHKSLYHRVKKARSTLCHKELNVTCPYCDAKLINDARLSKHIKKIHPRIGEKK